MGRYCWCGKDTIDDYIRIDIKYFKDLWCLKGNRFRYRTGTFAPTCNWKEAWTMRFDIYMDVKNASMVLSYTYRDSRSGEECTKRLGIKISKSKCNYWWFRYWFVCPNCWKRYVSLYLWNNREFYCRKCHNLCYPDQKFSDAIKRFNMVCPRGNKANKVYRTIKYEYRNGKITRKYKRYLKLMRRTWTQEDIRERNYKMKMMLSGMYL